MTKINELKQKAREMLSMGVIAAAIVYVPLQLASCKAYTDIPMFDNKFQSGRTKNSVAALVAGVAAYQISGNQGSEIDMDVKKFFYPDASLTGNTTASSIHSEVDLITTRSTFDAAKNAQGMFSGNVKKSEYNWNIVQTGEGKYEVQRLGWKMNSSLDLRCKDGKITGEYHRPLAQENWVISGTYDTAGNVEIDIDGFFTWGVTLEGRISGK